MRPAPAFLFALSCAQPGRLGLVEKPDDSALIVDRDSGRPVEDSDPPSGPTTAPPEDLGDAPRPPERACDALFEPGVVQEFNVEIAAADWAGIQTDYGWGGKNYHPITLVYGEERVAAQLRLKGNPSFSWFVDKMQFVVSVNEDDPDGRFHGMRKLAFDAAWYEPTLLRDQVAWNAIRRQGGLPDTCVGHAALSINGEYYGVYALIEYLDREWLERNFGDAGATGTLWKYGTEAVSNAEASDGAAVTTVLNFTDLSVLSALGDPAQWSLAWAAEVAIGDDDGFWCCAHNFYLYEHPDQGVMFVPWDLDDAFDVQDYNVHPMDGYGSWLFGQPLFEAVVNDPLYAPIFIDQVEEMADALDPAVVVPEMEAQLEVLAPYIEADPHRSWGYTEHGEGVERMIRYLEARREYLRSWAACARGEGADVDGDGYTVCADPHDADASIHPGAVEDCNGVDDDADGWIDDNPACEDCTRRGVDGRTFLFCRWPRTAEEDEAHCLEEGGALAGPTRSGDTTFFFFYTWPVAEHWWTGGPSGGARCPTWDEGSFSTGSAPCGESHPSVCLLDVATP